MAMQSARLNGLLILTILLLSPFIVMCNRFAERPYLNPLPNLQNSDLVGVWEVRYFGGGVDRLTIRADGTFKQVYRGTIRKDYVWETPWNEWWLECFSDGRVRLHLRGARFYSYGISVAEYDGMFPFSESDGSLKLRDDVPFLFYDPVRRESVEMLRKLVLNVRRDSSGTLILMHMWKTSDRGFPIFMGGDEEFIRVETP
jgi:hypothetical protein